MLAGKCVLRRVNIFVYFRRLFFRKLAPPIAACVWLPFVKPEENDWGFKCRFVRGIVLDTLL